MGVEVGALIVRGEGFQEGSEEVFSKYYREGKVSGGGEGEDDG